MKTNQHRRLCTSAVFTFVVIILSSSWQHVWPQWAPSSNNSNNINNTNSGNVGIGTSNPVFPLQVKTVIPTEYMAPGSTLATFAITNHTDVHGLYFGVGPSGNAWLQVSRHDGSPFAYNLILQSQGGNVGIGTTSPLSKLHVAG